MFPAAFQGALEPDLANDDDDPNLRFSSDTGSRVTDSGIFALAGEWQGENLSARVEIAHTASETTNPNLSTTLNFINPSCPLDGTSNDNCTPFIYDLSRGSLSWGINFDSPFAPTVADLTNPANVVLDQVQVARNVRDVQEDAFRVDFTYDLEWNGITSIDFGYRYNESSNRFFDVDDNIGGFSRMVDSPNGVLFQELLVTGPRNYNKADGRQLFIQDFLLVDPDRSFSDRDAVLEILQNAVIQHDPDSPDILNLASDQNAFFDVSEETSALYVQANFEAGIFRGNFGFRYIESEIDSIGFGPEDANGARSLQSTKGDYDYILPRINIVAQPRDDLIIRLGYGSDIRRPDFDDLATGFKFDTSENAVVALGNPGLEPEEVDSFDISFEWYFADNAVASIGYFTKDRTNIFGIDFEGALLIADPNSTSGFSRETDPSCPGGGIFNPEVVPNVLGDPNMLGLCVDVTSPGNDPGDHHAIGYRACLPVRPFEFRRSPRLGFWLWLPGELHQTGLQRRFDGRYHVRARPQRTRRRQVSDAACWTSRKTPTTSLCTTRSTACRPARATRGAKVSGRRTSAVARTPAVAVRSASRSTRSIEASSTPASATMCRRFRA